MTTTERKDGLGRYEAEGGMNPMINPDELERLARAATPGPWAWMGSSHSLYLATTHSGRKYVMGFRRMGMQAAQPVFRVGERLVPASDLVMFEVGDGTARGFAQGEADPTVYRRDVSGIDAPDAAFIAAANPAAILALLSANREMREALEEIADYGGGIMTADDACELARSALTTQRGDGE